MTDLDARDRSASNASSKQQPQQDIRSSVSEPRTLSMDYTSSAAGNGGINGLGGNRHDSYYDQQQQQQQQQEYTANGYHPSASAPPSSSSSSSTLVPSHYSHAQGNASGYLPPPIQTTPLSSNTNNHNSNGHHLNSNSNSNSNNNNNNGSSSSLAEVYSSGGHHGHPHDSFTSPTSPLSPVNGQHYHPQQQQQQQQQYYDYDQGGPQQPQQYSSHAYHAYHASYPQEHHQHPLSPSVEGGPHFQYMPQSGGNGSTVGASTMGSNGLYSTSASSSSSSARHNSYPSNSSNHHSSASSGTMYNAGFDDLQDSPGGPGHPAGSMPLASPVGSYVGHRDSIPGFSYSTSAPSPSTIVRPKRRSDVYASHESPYFYPAHQHYNLYSMDRSASYNVKITAKIDRGFFLAANDWTCYRRNYFQLSASFSIIGLDTSMHSEVPCLLERGGELITITQFLICIGARIQNGEKVIELVQHTPKRDKGPQMTPRPSPVRAGGDLNHNPEEANPTVVTFERVQFKTATANNGKRRAAQQYYQVHVDLYAETDRGELIMMATSNSAPLVVRGRSPGHYADNDEQMMQASTMGNADFDRSYYDRNNSVSSSNGDYSYYPPYSYGSYPYQSLSSASHLAQQGASHDGGYYDRVGPSGGNGGQGPESYPTSPLSPVSPQGQGHPDQHGQGGGNGGGSAYPSYITPPQVSHGSSPEAVSPDMYSPAGFVSGPTTDQSPPSSSASSMHRVAPFHTHAYQQASSQQYPSALGHDQQQQQLQQQAQQQALSSDGYDYASSQYGGSEQGFEDDGHEVQMAGLRIHSPVNSPPGTPAVPRRQSFSVANKKGDRLSSMAGPQGVRKPRSITVSAGVVPAGVAKRSTSKTRVTSTVHKTMLLPHAVKEELGKGVNNNGFSSMGKERSIPESPMEEHHHQPI
ncbi:hypothetical protein DFQ26_003838 [Actinomortierella ambigua]|nr:hypothetical protein DFQ26_003838 [Actinomortierella ambigua]